MSNGTITDTTVYPASATPTNSVPPASGLTLQMNDVNADQDVCLVSILAQVLPDQLVSRRDICLSRIAS